MGTPPERTPTGNGSPELEVDAGEMGCGDLVILLNKEMRKLGPGQVVKVHAYDPAAPIDLPAWCRLRGHEFLGGPNAATGPPFFIRKGGT